MRIIFGLGNPGIKYRGTRHNIGYRVIEELARSESCNFKLSLKFNADVAIFKIEKEKIILVKPGSYMNNSGVCLVNLLNFYKTDIQHCLVVYDDADLALGVLRFREKGSAGGHKGMESIIEYAETDKINRLRVGIGRSQQKIDLADYVLSEFFPEEKEVLNESILRAVSACIDWLRFGNGYVMEKYN